MTFRKYISL